MDTETRTLKCILTDEERRALLDAAAKMTVEDKALALAQIDRIAASLKTAKASAEAIQAQVDAKLDTANRGWESRQVDCKWVPDKAAQVMRLTRTDTGEIVETREMPRQQKIDGVSTSVHTDATKEVREQDVLDAMTREPMRFGDIIAALWEGVDEAAVKRFLKMAVERGAVAQEGKARGTTYQLTGEVEE